MTSPRFEPVFIRPNQDSIGFACSNVKYNELSSPEDSENGIRRTLKSLDEKIVSLEEMLLSTQKTVASITREIEMLKTKNFEQKKDKDVECKNQDNLSKEEKDWLKQQEKRINKEKLQEIRK